MKYSHQKDEEILTFLIPDKVLSVDDENIKLLKVLQEELHKFSHMKTEVYKTVWPSDCVCTKKSH